MADDWERSRTFYSSLTLARDGDETEQHGAENYRLNERWPTYEQFWRFHVAPATERPDSIAIRKGVSRPVLDVIRANYQTFCHVVSACDYTAMLQTDVAYTRAKDWVRLLFFHAAAVKSFVELVASAERLITTLGFPPGRLPTDREEWRSLSDRHQTYQSYLAGVEPESVAWITDGEQRVATVLGPNAVATSPPLTESPDPAKSRTYERLVDAARLHLDDLIRVLNIGSGQLIDLLEPAQVSRAYHLLWGWYRG